MPTLRNLIAQAEGIAARKRDAIDALAAALADETALEADMSDAALAAAVRAGHSGRGAHDAALGLTASLFDHGALTLAHLRAAFDGHRLSTLAALTNAAGDTTDLVADAQDRTARALGIAKTWS